MNLQLKICLVVICLCTPLSSSALAEEDGKKKQKSLRVALLDVGRVFKEYKEFQTAMDRLKQEIKTYDVDIRTQHERLEALKRELRKLVAGSPEFAALEARIAKEFADLQVEKKLHQKKFMDAEREIYAAGYTKMRKQVEAYARSKKIRLVLKFNKLRPDPMRSNKIIESLNETVVFEDGLDITDKIIEQINVEAADAR